MHVLAIDQAILFNSLTGLFSSRASALLGPSIRDANIVTSQSTFTIAHTTQHTTTNTMATARLSTVRSARTASRTLNTQLHRSAFSTTSRYGLPLSAESMFRPPGTTGQSGPPSYFQRSSLPANTVGKCPTIDHCMNWAFQMLRLKWRNCSSPALAMM